MSEQQLFQMLTSIQERLDGIAEGVSKAVANSEQNSHRLARLERETLALEQRVAKLESQKATLTGVILGIMLASAGGGAVLAKLLLP